MNTYQILTGDVIQQLRTLPAGSIHTCVTSPPYWGLRDYGTATWDGGDPDCDHKPGNQRRVGATTLLGNTATSGHQQEGYRGACQKCGARRIDSQIGLEATPQQYVARLVEVFEEVRRVLRDDGTLWLNLGDSYASGKGTCNNPGGGPKSYIQEKERYPLDRGSAASLRANGLKPKDLVGIPWRVAFALQDAGWWLRAEIIWSKRAPMPESVTDRPTRSHEQIFLLTKSARYFYDAEAVRETMVKGAPGSTFVDGKTGVNGQGRQSQAERTDNGAGRNQRDVWLLGPEPYPEAHFATFPTEIPRRAIRAGTSERGCCPACGAPWNRVIEKGLTAHDGDTASQYSNGSTANRLALLRQAARERGEEYQNGARTTGWQPTCACGAGEPVPCTVLDPFLGSGTTVAVAIEQGRDGIGIELNPEYVELARRRIATVAPLLSSEL